ncbi:MAG: tRNA (guanosine(46)-N7)-methyltransferase TrmB [Ardenticatenales bacterium]|nr:tRNA (guanosine(46)-N7)-methyltransferase TrmB [Ardenticatenales bacterium]
MQTQVWLVNRLPWPTDWNAFFGREAPLLLEIGFGGGHFLVDLARKRPDANVLGIEISNPSLRRTQDRLRKGGITNTRLLYGDARVLFWLLCAPTTVQEVYINFPDPWPKPSHYRRRLVSDAFLQLAATRMPPGARLEIATDHPDYQAWINEHLARTPYFESTTGAVYVTRDDERPRTKYERQALDAGIPCHYYKFRRNHTPAPDIFPIPPELPMPNAIITTPLTLPQIQARFQPGEAAADSVHVRFIDAFMSARYPALLVEAYISEEPLDQRVGLVLHQRAPGEVLVTLHEIGFPRTTAGIHAALRLLSEWVASLHPDAFIKQHNLA